MGSASKWWLHHAIIDVKKQLEALGSTLIIRKGSTEEEILSRRTVRYNGCILEYLL